MQRYMAKNEERQLEFQLDLHWREMNEVHLLLDFVSGRSDKSLGALTDIPDRSPGVSPQAGTSGPPFMPWDLVVAKICAIRFPPEGGSQQRAQDAAFLLVVKDRLNAIADPAKGLTIAYTAMFSGTASGGGSIFKKIWRRMKRGKEAQNPKPDAAKPKSSICLDQETISPSFASAAYPNLESHARKFKWWFDKFPILLSVAIVLTALCYWDTALSNSIIQQIEKADGQVVSLFQNNLAIKLSDGFCTNDANNQTVPCQRLQFLRLQETLEREDLAALSRDHWPWHPIGWVTRVFAPMETAQSIRWSCFDNEATAAKTDDQKAQDDKYCAVFRPTALEQMAAAVTNAFNVYVVPAMFGFLGALIGLVRSISRKMRESTLSPRDSALSLITMASGVVAGLAVGLIFSSPTTYSETITGLPQSITVSAAAFAFLAGYGADSFFAMVDNLLKRIFSPDKPAAGK